MVFSLKYLDSFPKEAFLETYLYPVKEEIFSSEWMAMSINCAR
jgi:hypothetical protein